LQACLEERSLIFLACVVPIAVYFLVLAIINRRRHPVMVSGPWDFAGVLFASSGILLLGGPAILTGLYEQWRLSWLLGQTRYLQGIGEHWSFWISLWLLYFAVVAGGSAFVLWRRRRLTSIYNVEPEAFPEILTQVLDCLGVEWFRHGPHRLVVRFPRSSTGQRPFSPEETLFDTGKEFMAHNQRSSVGTSPAVAENALSCGEQSSLPARPGSNLAYPWAELDLDFSPAMRHVTLRWRGRDEAARVEVETRLAQALAQVCNLQNPIAVWFLCLALGLFFSAFAVMAALIVVRILPLLR
jgi:hypothetical protein